jgi:hypothetical protein
LLGGNRVNLRVSLIATATVGVAVGLALAEPAKPAPGKPLPAIVFALAAQAASHLPASQPPASQAPASRLPATLAAPTVPRVPAGYPLLLGTGADQGWSAP